MDLDATGKASFDHIYTQPDPREYYRTLRRYGYRIPQVAKPYFASFIRDVRAVGGIPVPTILDVGCSYGVNAALLKCDATMDELYERYDALDADSHTRDALVARDRELVRARGRMGGARFVGLDASGAALSYARSAGFLDDAVHADLEERDLTPAERRQLRGVDLVISTGCLGYVTDRTIARVVEANGDRKPWMAHFVLRMFSFQPVAERLAGLGYETVHPEGVFKQRRFASEQEQSLTLDALSAAGVDARGLEQEGWLYAELYVSRPNGGHDAGRWPSNGHTVTWPHGHRVG
jgi:SAM-dependent methyltransferase